MATDSEKNDWLRDRAKAEVELRSTLCEIGGSEYRNTVGERKAVVRAVRDDFQKRYGLGWLTILFWLPTIIQIVKAILAARYGQETAG